MRQRWWIAIVAVVGIGLAILLFPRPDTGDAITPEGGEQAADQAKASKRAPGDPNVGRPGVRPGMEDVVAKRNRPEAVYASKLVTPFSSIRYTLVKEGSEPAKALAEEISVVMNDLRTVRLDPEKLAWADLEARTNAMMDKIKASPFASNEQIQRSAKRYDDFLTEYHHAMEAGGAVEGNAPATPATPATPGQVPQPEPEDQENP